VKLRAIAAITTGRIRWNAKGITEIKWLTEPCEQSIFHEVLHLNRSAGSMELSLLKIVPVGKYFMTWRVALSPSPTLTDIDFGVDLSPFAMHSLTSGYVREVWTVKQQKGLKIGHWFHLSLKEEVEITTKEAVKFYFKPRGNKELGSFSSEEQVCRGYNVDWMRFVDEVESVFTEKHLEKDPLKDISQYRPETVALQFVDLSPEDDAIAMSGLKKIAHKVRQHRMQLFPLFEDFDICHHGNVSQNQLRRVLNELDLAGGITETEWIFIFKKFCQKVGSRDDVNYMVFCDCIYDLCGFEYRKP